MIDLFNEIGFSLFIIVIYMYIYILRREDNEKRNLINIFLIVLFLNFSTLEPLSIIIIDLITIFIVEIIYEKNDVWYKYGGVYTLVYYLYLLIYKYKIYKPIIYIILYTYLSGIFPEVINFINIILISIIFICYYRDKQLVLKNILDVKKELSDILSWHYFKVDEEKYITTEKIQILKDLEGTKIFNFSKINKEKIKSLSKKKISLNRGYSTIKMQFFRTNFIKEGYDKTKIRKIHEILFTNIYIHILRKINNVKKEEYITFDNYIYYLYLKTSQIGAKKNYDIEKFCGEEVIDLDNEHFFVLINKYSLYNEAFEYNRIMKNKKRITIPMDDGCISKYISKYKGEYIPLKEDKSKFY